MRVFVSMSVYTCDAGDGSGDKHDMRPEHNFFTSSRV